MTIDELRKIAELLKTIIKMGAVILFGVAAIGVVLWFTIGDIMFWLLNDQIWLKPVEILYMGLIGIGLGAMCWWAGYKKGWDLGRSELRNDAQQWANFGKQNTAEVVKTVSTLANDTTKASIGSVTGLVKTASTFLRQQQPGEIVELDNRKARLSNPDFNPFGLTTNDLETEMRPLPNESSLKPNDLPAYEFD